MSREILFKAKRISDGEWIEGSLLQNTTATSKSFIVSTTGCEEVDSDTICQYIGLVDNNGNKIWENDIVKDLSLYLTHKDYVERGMEKEEGLQYYHDFYAPELVEFCTEEVGSCGCCYPDFVGTGFVAMGADLTKCEVIGNKFDNPELLES